MSKRIVLTNSGSKIHLSFGTETIVLEPSEGFVYKDGELKVGTSTINCTQKEFEALQKKYHKAIRPKRSAHKVWALSFCYAITMCTLGLLFFGLSQPIPGEQASFENNNVQYSNALEPANSHAPIQPPASETNTSSENSNSPIPFPFGNS